MIINNYLLLIIYCMLFIIPSFVWADNMKSDNYELQMGNFNMTGGNKSSTNYKILDTVGQTAPGRYTEDGYIIRAGFPYIKTLIPFAFSISSLTIDMGTLTPETPAYGETVLTVSAGGAAGYEVTAYENHPLKILGGTTTIPDTTCNNPLDPCSESIAKLWNDDTAYGFGFNISGNDIPADFSTSNHYRQFSDQSQSETNAVVMSSVNVGLNRQATVKFKVNISGIQASGNYDNIITFIATPGF